MDSHFSEIVKSYGGRTVKIYYDKEKPKSITLISKTKGGKTVSIVRLKAADLIEKLGFVASFYADKEKKKYSN